MRKFSLYRYRIEMQSGLILRNQTQHFRCGLICCLNDGERQGWGEIAPLSGFSRETLEQAESQAKNWLNAWQNHIEQNIEALFPSVAFGLSMAQLEMRQGFSGPTRFPSVPLCSDSEPATIKRLIRQKQPMVKLKVGRNTPSQDAETLHRLLTAIPNLFLRLDANRAWNLETASFFAGKLSRAEKQRILFIEEPCQTTEQSLQFAQSQQIRIAWDESVQLKSFVLKRQPWLTAIVIKPTLIGSVEKCLDLIKRAHQFGMQAVISSALESSLGLSQLADLARSFTPQTAAGLDTLSLMKQQLIRAFPGSTLPLYGVNSQFLQKTG